ncbi:DsbA family protein [Achromobacter aegrifaciens]|uniref:DSBA-like thioredoxin domain n=1 Tax=Achromobacter aegrifaciens TaxID=1287736 RepID=A0AAD2KLW8_ACHAE|nr:DsbA family protein [Achromobacter aegrifaciens]CUJ69679.1 DSBA-like thioredoxin domain [Achromobacter aegrifaciens]
MKSVRVVVWLDFVCPWCRIATNRIGEAARNLAGEIEVVVDIRSYRMAKGVPAEGFTMALIRRLGNAAAADRLMAAVKETGSREGLDFRFDKMRFGDTTDAHAMVKSIDSFEKRQQLIGIIFHACTAEGKDIFDRRVLSALAIGQGLALHEFSFDARHLASVARDEHDAKLLAAGLPLFVFNDKIVLSGAQEVSVFEKAMRESAILPHAHLEPES